MSLLGETLDYKLKEPLVALSKRLKNRIEDKKIFEQKKPLSDKGQSGNFSKTNTLLRVVDEITTYFRTTSNYHYIPNLKDGIYPLVRPTSEQLALV